MNLEFILPDILVHVHGPICIITTVNMELLKDLFSINLYPSTHFPTDINVTNLSRTYKIYIKREKNGVSTDSP